MSFMILCVLLITIEFPSLCKLKGMTSRYLAAGAMCHASLAKQICRVSLKPVDFTNPNQLLGYHEEHS